jgi:hypothetical protein
MANSVHLSHSSLVNAAENHNVRPRGVPNEVADERLAASIRPLQCSSYPAKPMARSCLKKTQMKGCLKKESNYASPDESSLKSAVMKSILSPQPTEINPRRSRVKGILKKDASISPKGSSNCLVPKAVSWSDMSRWSSQGSGLDLEALVAKTRRSRAKKSPEANYKWDKTTGTTKSSSMVSLSVLDKELRKYKAPVKPLRQTSRELVNSLPIIKVQKKTPNPFQAAVMDFQNSLVKEASSSLPTSNAPKRPNRRGSVEENPSLVGEFSYGQNDLAMAPQRQSRRSSTQTEEAVPPSQ